MDSKVFYSVLTYFCYRKNISMSRLCILAGLNNCSLNKSKTIKINRWIRVDTFLKLCKALEISPVEFFKEYEKEKKNAKIENKYIKLCGASFGKMAKSLILGVIQWKKTAHTNK